MELSQEFWLQIVIYLVSFAFSGGVVWTKLKYIEQKQDNHNKLIERMYNVEEKTRANQNKIENIKENIE